MDNNDYTIIKYEKGKICVDVKVDYSTSSVWLTQSDMSILFKTTRSSISRFIKSILSTTSNLEGIVAEIATMRSNGGVHKGIIYNQEIIYQIGYRIKSYIISDFKAFVDNIFRNNQEIVNYEFRHSEANNFDIVTYNNGEIIIDVNFLPEEQTVWLNQNQLALLFNTTVSNINIHIKNIFNEKELEHNSVIKFFLITGNDGKIYNVIHYNLDMILSIGYRVNSKRGIEFRRWATSILKQYMTNGYSINEKRCLECHENLITLNNEVKYLLNKDKTIEKEINELKNNDIFKDKLFYKNNIFEAYSFIKQLFLKAKQELIIIDSYIDELEPHTH